MYSRECVPVGKTITLRAIFVDSCNQGLSLDEVKVSIADSSGTVDPTIYSLSSGDITEVAPGLYELEYSVPADLNTYSIGAWKDSWSGYSDAARDPDITQDFSFAVVELGKAYQQTIGENSLIVILLSPTIADIDGRTLGEELQFTFSTRYNPYYASPDLIRAEVGTWIDVIPDDTLSLLIHWSSREADIIAPRGSISNNVFETARTKFVIYDVVIRCLMLPVAADGSGTKQLGDLMVRKNHSFKDAIADLKLKREEWYRVVNARGTITPGQSFSPSIAVKGAKHPENRKVGRLWWSPDEYPYSVPAANSKSKRASDRKYRSGFSDLLSSTGVYPTDEEPD